MESERTIGYFKLVINFVLSYVSVSLLQNKTSLPYLSNLTNSRWPQTLFWPRYVSFALQKDKSPKFVKPYKLSWLMLFQQLIATSNYQNFVFLIYCFQFKVLWKKTISKLWQQIQLTQQPINIMLILIIISYFYLYHKAHLYICNSKDLYQPICNFQFLAKPVLCTDVNSDLEYVWDLH